MTSSSINKAVDVPGSNLIGTVRPIAVETWNNKDYQNLVSGLVPAPYDYIELTYDGSNISTAVYKTGGASGTTVATLTLTYDGSNITSVTRV